MAEPATRHIRTLFLSDIHLGTKGCQPELLLDFLKYHDADTIYLVGDIVDGWRLKSGWYWPQLHNDVVQKLLRKVRRGSRIIYVPGNHDEFMRDYVGSNFGGIDIVEEAIHETATGQRILVLHGDKFDMVVRHAPWLALTGDWAYDVAIWLSVHINRARRRLGLPYWSFSAWSKQKVKRAVNFISAFQDAVVADAVRHGVSAVLCGHIHQPAMQNLNGIEYINTGDWVESCTAVVEDHDGRLELVRWTTPAEVEASVRVVLHAPVKHKAAEAA